MTRRDTAQFPQSLQGIGIFSALSADAMAKLQKRCVWRHYEPDELIVDHLDSSNDVYFITAGEARATIYSMSGTVVTFTDLGPGEMFGEIAAIDGGPRSAGIEARTHCVVAAMPGAVFKEVLADDSAVVHALLHQMVSRIRILTTRVYEFSALAVNNRIQAEIRGIRCPSNQTNSCAGQCAAEATCSSGMTFMARPSLAQANSNALPAVET